MVKGLWLGVCLLLASTSVLATEQEEARTLCVDATAIAAKASGSKENTLAFACNNSTRSPEYWQCVIEKQKAGNDFVYSTGRCDKVDSQ